MSFGMTRARSLIVRERERERMMGSSPTAREARLQKKVEEALRSKMKARALKECDHVVSKFAECAKGRTFSVVWTCRFHSKELNECLHKFTNDDVLEEYKKQYILEQVNRQSS
ncbi:hypothetical protein O6H91_06G136200 [Diphasiastrum complanatum]|uniref:Uncharacterized protein n=1 Tax=Diphasiastrum complanatum TaxID=34168 RepID=A0ACC2DJJ8_DIPCM|nr:hypothetical protein O6H91_06G136200 [Diphasiastrum complanatum]